MKKSVVAAAILALVAVVESPRVFAQAAEAQSEASVSKRAATPLKVISEAIAGDYIPKFVDSTGTLTNSKIYESPTGRIGIGTTDPLAPFHIYGPATGQDTYIGIGPDPSGSTASALNLGYAPQTFGVGAGYINVRPLAAAVAPNPSLRFLTGNVERAIITNTGQIGIGLSMPTAPLHIFKSAAGALGPELKLENGGAAVGDAEAITFSSNGVGRAQIRSTVEYSGTSWPGTIEFWTGYSSLSERMRISADGNVKVTGSLGIGISNSRSRLFVASGEAFVDYAAGGTVNGGALRLASNAVQAFVASNQYYDTQLKYARNGGSGAIYFDTTSTATAGDIVFQTAPAGTENTVMALTEALRIKQNGGVQARGDFTTTGNISAGGVINAKYQDVAEWVPVAEDDSVANGEVVVLDPMAPNTVRRSSSAYDTSVAGVVSPQPGVLLGEGAANKAIIATTGRVRIKAVALDTPIRIGDLLVTSPKPGIAMRSEPFEVRNGRALHQPGTIIGKALEPLAAGEGEILVLLSLQ